MGKSVLLVVIGCDTDPVLGANSDNIDDKLKTAIWNDSIQGVLNAKSASEGYRDDFGNHPKITWFLRSDWQMNEIYNDWCWPANRYLATWEKFKKDGDEIGWHPHLWKWNEDKKWYQEIYDFDWVVDCLKKGHNSLSKVFDVSSVRMGWDYHNNITMNQLDSLGIKIDLSALPGIRNADIKRKGNIFDWSLSPEFFYHPSKTNYQRPDKDNLSIVELPVTCAEIPLFLSVLKAAANGNVKRKYQAEISKHPYFFLPSINKAVQVASQKESAFLVTYFHPYEMLEKGWLFSLNNYRSNLRLIGKIANKHNMLVQYITALEAARIIQASECRL